MFASVTAINKAKGNQTQCFNQVTVSITFNEMCSHGFKPSQIWITPHVGCEQNSTKHILQCNEFGSMTALHTNSQPLTNISV
jgi:hypothetical protein